VRILLVSQMVPYLPCHDGFRTIAAHLIKNFARQHTVALVAATGAGETPEQRRWAAPFCASIEHVDPHPWRHPLTTAPGAGLERMREAVLRTIARFGPDVLHIEGGALAPLAGAGDVPSVLSIHDSRALRAREFRRLVGHPLGWARARVAEWRETTWERRWFGAADACVVVSEEDRAAVRELCAGARVEVIPLGVDVTRHEFRRNGQAGRIVFTGNFSWPPNIDGAEWFATSIFPRIRARAPRAEFVIAGADPAPPVRALATQPGIRVTGTVPDLRPSIWNAAVYVSPVRAGFGMKNKILEAMALGTPIVATSRSLSGLADVIAGGHLVVADDGAAMADAVLGLLEDRDGADRMARAARSLVERRYGWATVASRYETLLATLVRPAAEATA
jgi:polysaccharide biosynthesis protein PslH